MADAGRAAKQPALAEIKQTLAAVQEETGIAYDEVQKKAIITAL